jgi:hypothetical protein
LYRSPGKGGMILVWVVVAFAVIVNIGSLDSIYDQSGQIKRLKAENENLHDQVEGLQAKNADLQDQVNNLEYRGVEEVTANEGLASAEEQDLQAQVEHLRSEKVNLDTQLDDAAAAAPAGSRHIEVKVNCNIPCDVAIMDDTTDLWISEEITGQQTFEADIPQDSGLLAVASNLDQSGQLYVGVYENGELVAEDSDPQYAQIMY